MALMIAGVLVTSHVGAAPPPISRSPSHPPPPSAELPRTVFHTTIPTNSITFTDGASVQNVLASALSFIAPRTLEEYSLKDLSLWGLDGVLRLDSAFSTEQTSSKHNQNNDTLLLRYHDHLILSRSYPKRNSVTEWIDFIFPIIQTSWLQSSTLQKTDPKTIIPLFLNQLFQHIDPYSRYVGPLHAHQERYDGDNKKISIGLTFIRHQEIAYPIVKTINVNSVAWEQGVSVGDTLIEVNGRDIRRVPFSVIELLLSGPADKKNIVTLRSTSGKIRTLALVPTELPAETVFLSYYGRYPVLRITHFSEHTASDLSQLVSALFADASDTIKEGDADPSSSQNLLPGLILDLRGNHGGILQQAVISAALFLNQGEVTTTEGRYPASNHVWSIQGGDLTNNTPLAVLVDGQTASAAEILASALADHHRAAIVGSSTYGKGLVQIMGNLPNKGRLFVSWGRNIAPLGWPLQRLGVLPQLCTTKLTLTAQITALRHGHSLEQEALYQERSQRTPVSPQTVRDIRAQCPEGTGTEEDINAASRLLSSSPAYLTALQSIPSDTSSPPSHF